MMKYIPGLAFMLALTSTVAMAGTPALSGDYVEVRSNHILGGGCTYSAEAETDANEAILAWRVTDGDLSGLSIVAVVLGDGNLQLGRHARETALFIDGNATPAQRRVLADAFTSRYADMFGTVKSVEAADITFRHTGQNAFEVTIPKQVNVATRTMEAFDHEPNCDRMVWYGSFTNDASVRLVETAQNTYAGDLLNTTWSISNKRSAYVGTFSFPETLAAR